MQLRQSDKRREQRASLYGKSSVSMFGTGKTTNPNLFQEVKVMPANVETMFYVREKPWHGLGTRVETAPTSIDALVLAGLDWTVEIGRAHV